MAKGDTEKTQRDIDAERTKQAGMYSDYNKTIDTQRQNVNPGERKQLWDTGTEYAQSGGMTDDAANRLRDAGRINYNSSSGGGGGGGSSAPPQSASGNPYASNGGHSAFDYVGPSAFNDVNWNFDESKDVFRKMAGDTGGFNQDRLNNINNTAGELGNLNSDRYKDVRDSLSSGYKDVGNQIDKLNQFGATGGMTQENYDKIDRDNFYEFEKTGGYSNTQLADIRARNNSSIPGFYQGLQDQMAQNKLRSGGYNSNFGATSSKLARQSAQQAAEQARNTETDLADRIRAGRMDASKTIASNELNLLQTLTPAKQAALASAAGNANQAYGTRVQGSNQLASEQNQGLNYSGNLNLGTQDLINRTRLGAASGIHNIELDDAQVQLAKAKGIDQYTIDVATGKDRYATAEDQIAAQERIANAGISASAGVANRGIDAQLAMHQADLNSNNERYIMGQTQQGRQFGMSNLTDIYGKSQGDQNSVNNYGLAGINGYSNSQNDLLRTQAMMAGNKGSGQSWTDNIMKALGMFGGGVPGFGGGGGSALGISPETQWGNGWVYGAGPGGIGGPSFPGYNNGPF